MHDKVVIHKEEYERLKKEHDLLAILRSHGIEQWEHWDKAVKALDKGSGCGIKWSMNFRSYPESKPSTPGYYITEYFNADQEGNFWKAIWWDGKDWIWWRKFHKPNTVLSFVEESRHDYYIPCMEYMENKMKENNNGNG